MAAAPPSKQPRLQDDAAEAARLYGEAKDTDLSPALRQSKLQEAIRKWNSCANKSEVHYVNLAKGNATLAALRLPPPSDPMACRMGNEFVLEPKLREYHYQESLNAYKAALTLGAHRDALWHCNVLQSCRVCLSDATLDMKLRLEPLANALGSTALQGRALHVAARILFHHGIKSLEADEWLEALRAFQNAKQPLTRALELVSPCDSMHAEWEELQELQESLVFHLQVAEGRQAIYIGNQQVNEGMKQSESLDMHIIWSALDKFSEAGVLGRECDIETEAISFARRGWVWAKVIRNETIARPLLMRSIELAASLAPRTFHHVRWYREAQAQLETYRKQQQEVDDRAEERRREAERLNEEPIREKLKPEIDALNSFAEAKNTYKLLEHIYEKYPPKAKLFTDNCEKALKAVKDASADTLKKVLLGALSHYHPDKNKEYGVEWKVLASEIAKIISIKYNMMKGQ